MDSIHSSIPLSLLFLPPLLSFWAARVFFPQGYQCPCPWVTYLFGVELATPPCKKPLQLPPVLGVEVGLGAIGVGKPVAMALIWVCWGRPTMQTPRVPTSMTDTGEYLWDPCSLRGAGGPLCPISDFGHTGGAADVVPAP